MKRAAESAAVPVHISHIGLFAGGNVLFCAPERDARLDALHEICCAGGDEGRPWTPHVTLLQDEPEAVCAAVPVLLRSFAPFIGSVVRLRLCAFWLMRQIASLELGR